MVGELFALLAQVCLYSSVGEAKGKVESKVNHERLAAQVLVHTREPDQSESTQTEA
mgnify:CR=1